MYLSEFIDELKYGELANLAIGNLEGEGLAAKDAPRIITAVNAGLRELYSHFALRTETAAIQLDSTIERYRLHSDFAQTNTISTEPVKYILDSVAKPFKDNILLIDNIFDSTGKEYTLNESYDDYTITTPIYDTFEVKFDHDNIILTVYYRSAPDNIEVFNSDPSTIWLQLPLQLVQCLAAFVLHKIHSSLSSGQEGNEAGMYYNKYLRELQRVKDIGLNSMEANLNTKLHDRGFP